MLESITLFNTGGSSNGMVFPILGVDLDARYIIKSIEGLGPPPVNVIMGDVAHDGSLFQSRRVPSRNVVITIGLNPDYENNVSITKMRANLYSWFLQSADGSTSDPRVRIGLNDTEMPQLFLEGYVDKFEITQFTKTPNVQISMICPDPYLRGAEIDTGEADFENGSGVIYVTTPGSVESGFQVWIGFVNSVPMGSVSLTMDDGRVFKVNHAFANGNYLLFDSRIGQRKVMFYTDIVHEPMNILGFVDPSSEWLTIRPGGERNLKIPGAFPNFNNLIFTPKWWGI